MNNKDPWDKFLQVVLVLGLIYFGLHVINAVAQTVLINQPNGGQTACIVQGNYVSCY